MKTKPTLTTFLDKGFNIHSGDILENDDGTLLVVDFNNSNLVNIDKDSTRVIQSQEDFIDYENGEYKIVELDLDSNENTQVEVNLLKGQEHILINGRGYSKQDLLKLINLFPKDDYEKWSESQAYKSWLYGIHNVIYHD